MSFQFAKIPRPILKKINLIDLIEKSIDFIKISSKSSINLITKDKEFFINGDEDQLNRVFINLVKNSDEAFEQNLSKYPKYNGNIEIEIYKNNDYIVCRLTDNGQALQTLKKL